MRKPTWEEITATANETGNWSNSDIAKFHYFNHAGLYAAKIATDEQISNLVKQGKCASGAIMAYGTFNTYSSDCLRELATEFKAVKSTKLSVVLNMLRDDIKKAKAFIAEKN